jgi:hypothetical protein
MQRVLQFANFVNQVSRRKPDITLIQGTYAGNAVGFKLASLMEVLTAKGRATQMRMVDTLAESAEDRRVLDLLEILAGVRTASMDDVESAVALLVSGIATARRDLADGVTPDSLTQKYDPFLKVKPDSGSRDTFSLQDAAKQCDALSDEIVAIRRSEKAVRDFYVAETMPLEKIFEVFNSALISYKQALLVKGPSKAFKVFFFQAFDERRARQKQASEKKKSSVVAWDVERR